MNPEGAPDDKPDTHSHSPNPSLKSFLPPPNPNFTSFDFKWSPHTLIMSTKAETKEFNTTAYSSVIKLSTGTFNYWKLCLTTLLGAQRLSKYILQDIDVPTESLALDDHETNSLRALAAIHATIDNEDFQVIQLCVSPRDAFQHLCKHHGDAGGLSTAHFFSDLVTTRMSSYDDLSEHIHKFRKVHNDLLSNLQSTPDIKISEPFIAIVWINSLPSEYTSLVQSLLANFETLTLTRLYSLLKIKATRTGPVNKKDTALSAKRSNPRANSDKKKEFANDNSSLRCSLGHSGHTNDNCRVRRFRAFVKYEENIKSEDPSKPQVAQMAQPIPESDTHPSYWEPFFSANTSLEMPTIGDTGATSHMFSNRSSMTDIQSIQHTWIEVASKDGAI